ncbi:MAG TPA: hypothetical protein VF169_25005 [Albitalea sp.]
MNSLPEGDRTVWEAALDTLQFVEEHFQGLGSDCASQHGTDAAPAATHGAWLQTGRTRPSGGAAGIRIAVST